MNKLLTKILGATACLAMAFGVGLNINSKANNRVIETRASTSSFNTTSTTSTSATTGTITSSINSLNQSVFTVTYNKNDAGNDFYVKKDDFRMYATKKTYKGNYITVSTSSDYTINSITFVQGDQTLALSTAVVFKGAISVSSNQVTGTSVSISSNSCTINSTQFTIWNNNNGVNSNTQVRFGSITINYQANGKTPTTTTVSATGNKTSLDVTESPADTVQLITVVKDSSQVTIDNPSLSYSSGAPGVATVSSTGLVTAVGRGKTTITVTFEGDSNNDESSGTIVITVYNPNLITYDTTDQNYTNGQVISSWSSANSVITVSFSNGTYYTSGTAIRAYSSSTITVSSTTKNITAVSFVFGSDDGSNSITANVGTWSSPNWSGEASAVQFSIGGSNGNRRIQSMDVTVADKIVITPTKTTIEWSGDAKTVYTSNRNNTLSTSDVNVYEKDASNNVAESHLDGTGFVLKIYKNDVLTYTLDASDSTQEKSFEGLDASSQSVVWTIKATVGELTESSALTLTVVAKDTTSLTWDEDGEQTGTFVSFVDKLHVDGKIVGTFNDGSNAQSFRITTEIYSGNSASALNLIYTRTVSKDTHKNGYDVTAANQEGKTLAVDANGVLAYTEDATFYIQMYYADYPAYKVGKVINVVVPTLYVEDGNAFNYYVGSTYSTAVKNVSLKYGGNVVKSLSASDVTLSPSSVTPANTNNITVTATYAATASFDITTTYSISPVQPAVLYSMELYDNSGDAMTDKESFVGFKAGDDFHLFNKDGEDYFAYVLDDEANDYCLDSYSDFTFELLSAANSTDGSGTPITTSTFMRKNMDNKWVRATYTQGNSSVQFTFQLYIEDMTIGTYSPAVYGDYVKVTSALDDYSGQYLIVYETESKAFDGSITDSSDWGLSGDYIDVTITNSTIQATAAMNASSFTITSVTNGYTIRSASGTYIGRTTSSNGINTDSTTQYLNSISVSSGNATIIGKQSNGTATTAKLQYLNQANSNTFKYYTSNQKLVQLYKRSITPQVGNPVTYLKEVIDAYRLNNDANVAGQGISICSATTGIYSSDYWTGSNGKTSVKTLFNGLTNEQRTALSVQDKYGEEGKTYVDTYEMLISKEPNQAGLNVLGLIGNKNSTSTIVVITSLTTVCALGAFLFLKKKKESK